MSNVEAVLDDDEARRIQAPIDIAVETSDDDPFPGFRSSRLSTRPLTAHIHARLDAADAPGPFTITVAWPWERLHAPGPRSCADSLSGARCLSRIPSTDFMRQQIYRQSPSHQKTDSPRGGACSLELILWSGVWVRRGAEICVRASGPLTKHVKVLGVAPTLDLAAWRRKVCVPRDGSEIHHRWLLVSHRSSLSALAHHCVWQLP